MGSLVAILIPVYNSAEYIAETIESALNQTYKDIEIIIVDDGSQDKSWEIVESFRNKNSAIIRTYKQANNGASAARNKAFELSKGDYIQYLDADDILPKNKLEEQVKLFNEHGNKIIVSCKKVRVEDNTQTREVVKQGIDRNYENAIEWLIDSWNGGGAGQTGIWLSPRKIIEEAGKWDESISLNDDGDFFCRVLLGTEQIIYCANTEIYYRDTLNSLGKRKTHNACESLLRSYENYVSYLSENTVSPNIKIALACNFSSFYSYVYPNFPDLLSRAEKNIHNLGLNHFPPVGGLNFKLLSKIIGLKRAAQIRYKI